jgi:hypothetical protein
MKKKKTKKLKKITFLHFFFPSLQGCVRGGEENIPKKKKKNTQKSIHNMKQD